MCSSDLTLVIPKQEVDYLFDLDDDLLAGMMVFSKKIGLAIERSEERRVGKECRARWSPYH